MENLAMINKQFWKNKRVLITGHTGFKGAWLILLLKHLGAELFGYALPAANSDLYAMLNLDCCVNTQEGDIRNGDCLDAFISKHSPEIILHLAAQPLVLYSYDNPLYTYSVNVMGTVNVFESARKNLNTKVLLNVTTDKCYANTGKLTPYQEDDPLGGRDPYSNSKACSELITQAYRHAYFSTDQVGIASARSGNVIGGGDWSPHRLIPDIVRYLIHKTPLNIRNPTAIRPWQYILDTLAGYLLLCERLWRNPEKYSSAWNFSPNNENSIPVESLVKIFMQHLGVAPPCWQHALKEPSLEEKILLLDSSKSRQALGWQPVFSIEEALQSTANWYRAYMNKANLLQTTTNQIQSYLQMLD